MPSDKINVTGVDATPNTSEHQNPRDNNLLRTLINLVCGVLAKDTPLSEIIQSPTEVSEVAASRNGMSEEQKYEWNFGFLKMLLSCVVWFCSVTFVA